jgi:aspartate kinase
MKERVRVQVLSSFEDRPGTLVVDEDEIVVQAIVSGIAYSRDEAKITLRQVADRPGVAAAIFGPLSAANVNVDMIVQNVSAVSTGKTDISFTLPMSEGKKAVDALNAAQEEIGFDDLLYDDQIGKVSVIGVGMRTHPGVTARFFDALAREGINIDMISTSEIRISVVVDAVDVDKAVRAAHTAFGLDSADGEAVVYAGTGR